MSVGHTKTLSCQEAHARWVSGAAVIVDVRQPFEVELAGTVPGAIHLPLYHLQAWLGQDLEPHHVETVAEEPVDVASALAQVFLAQELGKDLLILCRSGNRSGQAAALLTDMGFSVFNVMGGWLECQSRHADESLDDTGMAQRA